MTDQANDEDEKDGTERKDVQMTLGNPSADSQEGSQDQESSTDMDDFSQQAVQVISQNDNDERGTPKNLIRTLQNAIGGLFDLDPAAGAEECKISEKRFTKEDNGLAQDWGESHDTVWLNPPYSDLETWLKKVISEINRPDQRSPSLILCLLPSNTSTQWFQNLVTQSSYLCFIEGRLSFTNTDQSSPFANILAVYGSPSDSLLDTLGDLGAVYTKAEVQQAQEQSRLSDILETDGGATFQATPTKKTKPPAQTQKEPQAPTSPQLMLDVSDRAPAVPQGLLLLPDLFRNDILGITFSESLMGHPDSAPTQGKFVVQTVTPAEVSHDTGTPKGWDTALAVDPQTETYALLYQHPEDPHTVQCSIAANGKNWTVVGLEQLFRVQTPTMIPSSNCSSGNKQTQTQNT
jgi:phage N-6-adenine-methyltransferase